LSGRSSTIRMLARPGADVLAAEADSAWVIATATPAKRRP
jgi:hypothetical protein